MPLCGELLGPGPWGNARLAREAGFEMHLQQRTLMAVSPDLTSLLRPEVHPRATLRSLAHSDLFIHEVPGKPSRLCWPGAGKEASSVT